MTRAYASLPVPGSSRRPMAGARRVGDADAGQAVFVTAVLRRSPESWQEPGSPASQADVDRVAQFASQFGLDVTSVNLPARSVRLRGDVASMDAAFGVSLGRFVTGEVTYRGREGSVYIPAELEGVIVAILGLDDRPQSRAHFRVAGAASGASGASRGATGQTGDVTGPSGAVTGPPSAATGQSGSRPGIVARARAAGLAPQKIAAQYGFPTDVDGTGQTVAVIELGGGFRTEDLAAYFASQGLQTPTVEAISVDGATNAPGDDADSEVMLDIEIIGAVAQGASIAVYFGPNTTDGFYDAIAEAIHDTVRQPSIISISWGQAESEWTTSALDAYDALLADAAAAGITVYAAAGDSGATDGTDDGGLHVDFPASSPSAVGCGGTTLTSSSEVVWNDLDSGNGATGGGFSAYFATPAYQIEAGARSSDGRGVPDVSGNADPLTGYVVRVNGQDLVIGGTSAVAPLWAALTALANERNGVPAGAPHEALYAAPSAFRDIVMGDNAGFSAEPGWDACTGLGSPHGDLVASAFATV